MFVLLFILAKCQRYQNPFSGYMILTFYKKGSFSGAGNHGPAIWKKEFMIQPGLAIFPGGNSG